MAGVLVGVVVRFVGVGRARSRREAAGDQGCHAERLGRGFCVSINHTTTPAGVPSLNSPIRSSGVRG
ncbi:hypothetical protein CLV40_13144 [Actinokineospora auranticolor]|uniref:Uncharacterized protein n=1 Tax=Actinokineospora auranticolor TaxID=155976 RepID=A0A2S6GD55_9PSEU|nr:hypothetical protein CLV40_13144 [Actinokineospora auranticolor]